MLAFKHSTVNFSSLANCQWIIEKPLKWTYFSVEGFQKLYQAVLYIVLLNILTLPPLFFLDSWKYRSNLAHTATSNFGTSLQTQFEIGGQLSKQMRDHSTKSPSPSKNKTQCLIELPSVILVCQYIK